MSFGAPAMFAVVAAWVAAMVALELWDRRARRKLLARLGDAALVAQLSASGSPGRRTLRRIWLLLAGAALGVALARPQIEQATEVRLVGLDVVLALDVSTSMLVADLEPTAAMRASGQEPTRLALARELAADLVGNLGDDRLGPVVFAGAAAHFPLTADHEVALQFLSDIGPADLPRGSDLGEALRVARCLLRRELFVQLGCGRVLGRHGDGGRPLGTEGQSREDDARDDLTEVVERARAIVVISDGGEELAGIIAEQERLPQDARVPVIVVGVGSTAGGQVFEIDEDGRKIAPKRDARGQPVISRRSDDALRELAAATGRGSRYLVGQEGSALAIASALRDLPRGLTTSKKRRRQDVFYPLVFAAILLLLLEAATSSRRRTWSADEGPSAA